MVAIKNAVLVMRDHLIPNAVLLMEDGIIKAFGVNFFQGFFYFINIRMHNLFINLFTFIVCLCNAHSLN